jgi:hypothetical protein
MAKSVLTTEDRKVFKLMAEARRQYGAYVALKSKPELPLRSEFVFPSARDYSLDRPVGYCLQR